jgi:hypothetical protein
METEVKNSQDEVQSKVSLLKQIEEFEDDLEQEIDPTIFDGDDLKQEIDPTIFGGDFLDELVENEIFNKARSIDELIKML